MYATVYPDTNAPTAKCSFPTGDWNGMISPNSVMPNRKNVPSYSARTDGGPTPGCVWFLVGARRELGRDTGLPPAPLIAGGLLVLIPNVRSLPPVFCTVSTDVAVSPVVNDAANVDGATPISGAMSPSPCSATVTDPSS